ncbi:hypothetical protein ACOSQ3_026952 [Xanthoceras sorbifolium]
MMEIGWVDLYRVDEGGKQEIQKKNQNQHHHGYHLRRKILNLAQKQEEQKQYQDLTQIVQSTKAQHLHLDQEKVLKIVSVEENSQPMRKRV